MFGFSSGVRLWSPCTAVPCTEILPYPVLRLVSSPSGNRAAPPQPFSGALRRVLPPGARRAGLPRARRGCRRVVLRAPAPKCRLFFLSADLNVGSWMALAAAQGALD